ncbi:unnamed protein product [Arabidopsis lyrata]|nr:unnamed protein product [Arabidopsis lyrata]
MSSSSEVTETPEEQVPEQPLEQILQEEQVPDQQLELIPQEEARGPCLSGGTSPRAATGTDSTRGGKYTLMLSMLIFCIQDHVYQEEQALGVAKMDFGHVFQEEQALGVDNMDFACYEELSPDEQVPEQQLQQIPIEEQALGVADMVFGCYEPGDYTAMLLTKQLTTNPIMAVDENTRAITVDTMLASEKASMYPNAIHLAVLVFDQYFATLPLDQGQAAVDPQTAITMALFIAVKYEYGIDKSTRMTFPIRDLDMEMQILSSFNYRLTAPTTKTFVDLYLSLTEPHDATFRFLCSYITELSLLDRECSVFDPSLLATSCVFLAEFVLHPDVLPTRVFPWEYSADDVRHTVMFLHAMLVGRRHQVCRFTRTRYASVRFGSVASLPCRDPVPEQFFA